MTSPRQRVPRIVVGLLVAALVAAGCSNLAPDSLAYADDTPSTRTETTIRIATTRSNGFARAIDDWEREHPTAHVEVVVRNIDDHHLSVLDNAGAGGVFDILAFDAEYSPEVLQHPELFVDLRNVGGDRFSENHLPARWAEGVASSGELIGLPIDVDSVALAIRTDLVDQHAIDVLTAATTWCQFISLGDDYSDETEMAFLPDGDELLTSILAQNRYSFFDSSGKPLPDEIGELQNAWDLTMLAIGATPVGSDTCPQGTGAGRNDISRISRNLVSGDETWGVQLRNGGFVAVLARHSELRRLTLTAPATAGAWTLIGLPGSPSASAGGIHLGLSVAGSHRLLAYDLISYLADPAIQQSAFTNHTGPFPSASVLYKTSAIKNYTDEFFGNTQVGSIFADAAIDRPQGRSTAVRRAAIEEFTTALNRVESGTVSPIDAWDEAVAQMAQLLG